MAKNDPFCQGGLISRCHRNIHCCSEIFDKVGLYTREPYSTQPTKHALLTANFILLPSDTRLCFSRSNESKDQCDLHFGCLMDVIYTIIRSSQEHLVQDTEKDVRTHQYVKICAIFNLWPQVNSHSHTTKSKPTSTIFSTSVDRWKFKIKEVLFFRLRSTSEEGFGNTSVFHIPGIRPC